MLTSVVIISRHHRPSSLFRHRDEKPVTASPLDSPLTICYARNPFRIQSYENCRVAHPSSSIFILCSFSVGVCLEQSRRALGCSFSFVFLNLQPSNMQTLKRSYPNSFPHNLLSDPHPVNPALSIFYKNIGGEGPASVADSACPDRVGAPCGTGRPFSSSTVQRFDVQSFKRVSDPSPLFSSSCALLPATAGPHLFWNQFVAHSFRCDGGCTPLSRPPIRSTRCFAGGARSVSPPVKMAGEFIQTACRRVPGREHASIFENALRVSSA
jgi:hypothetical protein